MSEECRTLLWEAWKRWQVRALVFLCKGLLRTLLDSPGRDIHCSRCRGIVFDVSIDPFRVLEEPDFHWGRYAAYIYWLHTTVGFERILDVLIALERKHSQHVASIWVLLATWIPAKI